MSRKAREREEARTKRAAGWGDLPVSIEHLVPITRFISVAVMGHIERMFGGQADHAAC